MSPGCRSWHSVHTVPDDTKLCPVETKDWLLPLEVCPNTTNSLTERHRKYPQAAVASIGPWSYDLALHGTPTINALINPAGLTTRHLQRHRVYRYNKSITALSGGLLMGSVPLSAAIAGAARHYTLYCSTPPALPNQLHNNNTPHPFPATTSNHAQHPFKQQTWLGVAAALNNSTAWS